MAARSTCAPSGRDDGSRRTAAFARTLRWCARRCSPRRRWSPSRPRWPRTPRLALARGRRARRSRITSGTIVYQHGGRVETSRLVHLNEHGDEFEKLVNLEGPAREVIRSHGEVRCYYPDAKVVRIEPRTFRNAFPSLSPQQQAACRILHFPDGRARARGGLETQAWVFEPKDGLRYGHKFWADPDRARS